LDWGVQTGDIGEGCFLHIMLDRGITMMVRKTNVALIVNGASDTDDDYPSKWFSNMISEDDGDTSG
jgi:hypothetical protein